MLCEYVIFYTIIYLNFITFCLLNAGSTLISRLLSVSLELVLPLQKSPTCLTPLAPSRHFSVGTHTLSKPLREYISLQHQILVVDHALVLTPCSIVIACHESRLLVIDLIKGCTSFDRLKFLTVLQAY